MPIGVFQSMFSVVALETFHLPAEQNGYLLSYVGVLTMVSKMSDCTNLLKLDVNNIYSMLCIFN